MKALMRCVLGLLSLLFISSTFANELGSIDASSASMTGTSIVQVILALGIVLAVIFLLAWLAKRINGVHTAHQQMKVVATLAVGTRERVMLIQVGDQQVLLGVAAGHITHLATYAEPVIDPVTPNVSFAASLREVIQREEKP